MNTFFYYSGYILLPLLFLVHLVKNVYRSIKVAVHNTMVLTARDIQAHKRAFNKD